MKQVSLSQLLERGLETVVRNANPWWLGEPIAGLPSFRRTAFEPVYHRLARGLAPAVVLRGPRQVGKTTLLTQVVDQFIRDGVDPKRLFLAGHIAESVVGYFFRSLIGLDVAHFPERNAEPEVDFVLTVGEQRIPVEVKYRRRIEHRDTLGLRAFIEKAHYNAPFGVLVTMLDDPGTDDPRIVSLPLSSLLLMR
jgi:predicted AAA+ superfamily ATPase